MFDQPSHTWWVFPLESLEHFSHSHGLGKVISSIYSTAHKTPTWYFPPTARLADSNSRFLSTEVASVCLSLYYIYLLELGFVIIHLVPVA